MFTDPAEALRMFLHIPQSEIDRDLASASTNLESIIGDIRAFLATSHAERPPLQEAQYWHNLMLQAHALQQNSNVPEDMAIFYVGFAARQIVNAACMEAHSKGRLDDLNRELRGIEEREGLDDDEFWRLGEGPDDYQALSAESESLFSRVEDTIMGHTLNQYRLGSVAKAYEDNRATYEVMFEVGRRLVSQGRDRNTDADGSMSAYILEHYGQAAFDLLQRRLAAVGL
jgi:hypothetical protein